MFDVIFVNHTNRSFVHNNILQNELTIKYYLFTELYFSVS